MNVLNGKQILALYSQRALTLLEYPEQVCARVEDAGSAI
jgi:hypothetical protein